MKTASPVFVLSCVGCFLALSLTIYAESFSGKVSDLDAGNGYLTVTDSANETTKTFKVTSETTITSPDGKPSQLLNLIEGPLVVVDVDPGDGKVASRIKALPDAQEPP